MTSPRPSSTKIRRRDSVKARRICFDTHKTTDHLGRVRLICHRGGCVIDPTRDQWRADHRYKAWADGGEDSPENLWPICLHCDVGGKASEDTRRLAKDKRIRDRHFGIRRSKGFPKPKGAKFDWSRGRYVRGEEVEQ